MDSQYYKDRLGFEPLPNGKNSPSQAGRNSRSTSVDNGDGYEENLTKIKDERDAIQKKTFTKWVNKHLKKCGRHVRNLFVDLCDGKSLLGLLEVLSGERLPSQKGQLRFHQLQNVQVALDFLRFRKIKLVNIRADDIVDGNPKLILGLIWTIILHFQISDIVDGDNTVNVREALLHWAQRTTERYPGVRVTNFTSSWRDGLAVSAIIHRNRPDLIDWRELQSMSIRSRLDQAFHVVEQEYGVTRLLDPEDVDTNEPDEKSLITYISTLYDIFPEPPASHPLFDAAAEKSLSDYKTNARHLHEWIRQHTTRLHTVIASDTGSGSSGAGGLTELRHALRDSEHFQQQQLPPRQHDKNKLLRLYEQLERSFYECGKLELEPELHAQLLERSWSQLISLQQEYHQRLQQQLSSQERLQKLAEKVQQDVRSTGRRLDTLEQQVLTQARLVLKSRPRDVKQHCEQIETELVQVERCIQQMFQDTNTLQEGRHSQAHSLHRDVQQVHSRWNNIRQNMQENVLGPLSKRLNENPEAMLKRLIESDANFRFLSECLDWVNEKLVQIREAEYGHDLHSCQEELEQHQKEHKVIDQFQVNLERCVAARKQYDDEELTLYMRLLSQLQKSYADLLSSSNKRLTDLMIVHDFVQAATGELIWLNDREETETTRDWSERNQDLTEVDAQYEQLMTELERRERPMGQVRAQGESLVQQQHPAAKTVEAYLAALQSQWSWLLQLAVSLETHLKHARVGQQVFADVDQLSHTMNTHEQRLNGEFNVAEFSMDVGEQLLRDMQLLRDSLARHADQIQQLDQRAAQLVPLKQRRSPLASGNSGNARIRVTAVCNYKNSNVSLRKHDECDLLSVVAGSGESPHRWTVRLPAGGEASVPSVCFQLPPPDREAQEAVERLKRQLELLVTLWQRKQMRMRQNMIFATIKVVKSWDLQQFIAMGHEQRDAIRRALNEDADKLIAEGDPNEPQLRRLRREMDEVNELFDKFERLEAEASPTNQFHTKIDSLEAEFERVEQELKQLCSAPLADTAALSRRQLAQHTDWQHKLQLHESTLDEIQGIFESLSKKTPSMQSRMEQVVSRWDSLWSSSNSYVERLKSVDTALTGLDECETMVTQLETNAARFQQLPDGKNDLRSVHLELVNLQNSLQNHQLTMEQLNEDTARVRQLTERTRPRQRAHADVDQLEDRVARLNKRFTACCQLVVDRLRAADQAADLLSQYEQQERMQKQWAAQQQADAERARRALLDKLRSCDTDVHQLLSRLAELERRLANQQLTNNGDDVAALRNQLNIIKAIKDELKTEQRVVSSCEDQLRNMLERAAGELPADQLQQLQASTAELRKRYDNAVDYADTLSRRLSVSIDELSKYQTDLATFQSWLSLAERSLSSHERQLTDLSQLSVVHTACRQLVNDVIAHQADVRFTTVGGQRFIDAGNAYVTALNELRASLPQRMRSVEQPQYLVKQQIDNVTKTFQSLLSRANALLDNVSQLMTRQREYEHALERATRWLRDIEPSCQQLLDEPASDEPRQLQEQLTRARALSSQLLANGRLVEAADEAAQQLVQQLSSRLSSSEQQQILRPPAELTQRYQRLRASVEQRCNELDGALTQSQDVVDGLDSFSGWLSDAERQLQQLNATPASLLPKRLAEQRRQLQLLTSDVEQHSGRAAQMRPPGGKSSSVGSCGGGGGGRVGSSLQDAATRYDRLALACRQRGQVLAALAAQLDAFWPRADRHHAWLLQRLQLLTGDEITRATPDSAHNRVESVSTERDRQQTEHAAVLTDGGELVATKDTTDSADITDRIKELESMWRELDSMLVQCGADCRARADSLAAYERLRDEVLRWLQRFEQRLDDCQPPAVEPDQLRRQLQQLEPMVSEYEAFTPTVQHFNDLSLQYDAVLRLGAPAVGPGGDVAASGVHRLASGTPKSRTPTRTHQKTSSASFSLSSGRAGSQERRTASPSGSPFLARKRVDSFTKLDDVSQVLNQLNEVNDRFEVCGARLADRRRDLEQLLDQLQRHLDQLQQLQAFLDERTWRHQLPADRDAADRQLQLLRQLLDEMHARQPSVDALRDQLQQLQRGHAAAVSAAGRQELISRADKLMDGWRQRLQQLKGTQQLLQDCGDFFDADAQLNSWLTAKEKMFAVLGAVGSEPRLVSIQSQQVAVLRDEFSQQQPTLAKLAQLVKSVVSTAGHADPVITQMEDSARATHDKWQRLLALLDAREQSLAAASGAGREFNESFNRLQRHLYTLADQFDDISTERQADPGSRLRRLETLSGQLDAVRPQLTQLTSLAEQLSEVLTDPAAKSDVSDKLHQLDRQYNQLLKKVDYLRAELDSCLKEDRQFTDACADVQQWMKQQLQLLARPMKLSADRDKLARQQADYEPVYKQIMAREHEVFLLQRKGTELNAKCTNAQEARDLDEFLARLQTNWQQLKDDAVSRHSRLQACVSTCDKYHTARETFDTWLTSAEQRAQQLPAVAFDKTEIQRQLRDLASLQHEQALHATDRDGVHKAGERLRDATDTDHPPLTQQMQQLHKRWLQLERTLAERHSCLDQVAVGVAEFCEQLGVLQRDTQRCEDRLASHESLGARDPRLLGRLTELQRETERLTEQLAAVRQQAQRLCADAVRLGSSGEHLQAAVDEAAARLEQLTARLSASHDQLSGASQAVARLNDCVKRLYGDLTELDDELDGMAPIARTVPAVERQADQMTAFNDKVQLQKQQLQQAEHSLDEIIKDGYTHDDRTVRGQLNSMGRQLKRVEERAGGRHNDIRQTLDKLAAFYRLHCQLIDQLTDVCRAADASAAGGADVAVIKRQQQQFRAFRADRVEPLAARVSECRQQGTWLVQTAAVGVDITQLQQDVDALNRLWTQLQEQVHSRERALDTDLLQSGKFREALQTLLQWLADTEQLVANQKPPSADYQVVKAQLQEQKFLQRLLADRADSVTSLVDMGRRISAGSSPHERAEIDSQLDQLVSRVDQLNRRADERMRQLEDAMKVAKQYQDMSGPLVEWLDSMEKRLRDMELVPTDENKINARIREHEALHDTLVGRRDDFDRLAAVADQLTQLVGDDEAAGVAEQLQLITDRYTQLVDDSQALRQLLRDSGQRLRALVLNYEELVAWMDDTEARLDKYRVLSVHVDSLHAQMEELTDLSEEVDNHRSAEQDLQDIGSELMKNITSEEALQLKDKLDSVSHRYSDLESKAASLLKNAQEVLPLVHGFHSTHAKLTDWLLSAEQALQSADSMPHFDETIEHLMQQTQDYRPLLERLNQVGAQLCQVSPGDGAHTVESLVARDNRRFEAIVEQVQRQSERLRLAKQKNSELMHNIDDLLEWFTEVEGQLRDAEPASCEAALIRVQLKEQRALNDDVAAQRGRVRDTLSAAKRLVRDARSQHDDDVTDVHAKSDQLRELVDLVSRLSSDRLSSLEQALPLAEHLYDSHQQLSEWLDEAETEAMRCGGSNTSSSGGGGGGALLRPEHIQRQQEMTRSLLAAVSEHKPLFDKLNKTAAALVRLCAADDVAKVNEIVDTDNARYDALRSLLRERQQALEEALQQSCQFSDKLNSMLDALKDTADQVDRAEPISAHVDRIQDQMAENNAIKDALDKRETALQAVQRAADDIISKAGHTADPAVRDIKNKLDTLNKLWKHLQKSTGDRGRSLDEALAVAEQFWSQLRSVMRSLHDLQQTLSRQEPPAVQPTVIKEQQQQLHDIRSEIDQAKPDVELVRRTGSTLMKVCGEPEKPDVRKNLADLGSAWDNITALYARREENLIDAMEKAMEFHETMQRLMEFLERAEGQFAGLGAIGSDIEAVKRQIKQLMDFKNEVDPQMVHVETLNRMAHELMERTSPNQASALKRPIAELNTRWDDLLKGLVERQRQLDQALLRLGQFQHALDELLVWIGRIDKQLDALQPSFGDPQVIEIELAKLKVTSNDIQAHQTSVDTLNDAGRQLIDADRESADAGATHRKLLELNERWSRLQEKATDKQQQLEKVLRDAQGFMTDVQDLLFWLNDLDGALTTNKPVGGLPETAREQLERFMELFGELEENRSRVTAVLTQGDQFLASASEGACTNMRHSVKTLRHRWDHVMNRANDKKIKLEIALKEAAEFQETLEQFIAWLTSAEASLSGMQSVSRVLETVVAQIDEHKQFQKAVSAHRECMLNLERRGNQLKYFSQKQDVILIKNMLVSVQHRWERVVSKSAERTRALDTGYKEAEEFDGKWRRLCEWLDSALQTLQESDVTATPGNSPDKVRALLDKHKQFQEALGGQQANYDAVMRLGRLLIKDKAPKSDESQLRSMLDSLKDKWTRCCSQSVARQHRLEEALLFSGQYTEAMAALLEWLREAKLALSDRDAPLHGDLDTVTQLCERHKTLAQELAARGQQVRQVESTAHELQRKADKKDADVITAQVSELSELWRAVSALCDERGERLKTAMRDAERLHKAVHVLLEWLSDAEMRLRFVAAPADSEEAAAQQLAEHERFMHELWARETDKDATLQLAAEILDKAHADAVPVIRHWQTIIESRWDEVSGWALQRRQRLQQHAASVKDLQQLLAELLQWVRVREQKLVDLEPLPLPDDVASVQLLVDEHQQFMEELQSRQTEVDRICRPKHRPSASAPRKMSNKSGKGQPSPDRESTPGKHSGDSPDREVSASREYDKPWLSNTRSSSPGRERSPDSQWPRIGPVFPGTPVTGRKSSRASAGGEPSLRDGPVRDLWDSWRHTWMMAWERQRRLQEKLAYAREVDKLQNFDFEEWRRRFMRYANQKKLRITDLFRRMDTDNDGCLEKFEFIDGILKTNFASSKLEMQMVADMVDRNGDGVIDYNEFMSALKPDWEKNRPLTEAEKIDDEVKKACAACTCRTKFKVFQVGEGKYRFGDSQKLRLVRILRSTVMVRVGGGWEALDEFLVKNDPCRAKGRTNVELREQFILAPGVSQTMAPFRSKRDTTSPAGSGRSVSVPTAGPITKIREKTDRSIPLSRGSVDVGETRSPSSGSSGAAFSMRKSSTPLSRGGGGGGGGGSRPGSRAGSDLSLDSVDGRGGVGRTASRLRHVSTGSATRRASSRGAANGRKTSTIPTPMTSYGRTPSSSDGFSLQQRRVVSRPSSTTPSANVNGTSTPSRIPVRQPTSGSCQSVASHPDLRATTPVSRSAGVVAGGVAGGVPPRRVQRTTSALNFPVNHASKTGGANSLATPRCRRQNSGSQLIRRASNMSDSAGGRTGGASSGHISQQQKQHANSPLSSTNIEQRPRWK